MKKKYFRLFNRTVSRVGKDNVNCFFLFIIIHSLAFQERDKCCLERVSPRTRSCKKTQHPLLQDNIYFLSLRAVYLAITMVNMDVQDFLRQRVSSWNTLNPLRVSSFCLCCVCLISFLPPLPRFLPKLQKGWERIEWYQYYIAQILHLYNWGGEGGGCKIKKGKKTLGKSRSSL